jgi:putative hydrolase of the HAD superfamily
MIACARMYKVPILSHIDTWVFDLDNTLYHPRHDLFKQVDLRMGAYIQRLLGVDAAEAYAVQKSFFREHGTTLRGLMAHHDIDPLEFLNDVHDVDMSVLPVDAELISALEALPGRKLVFTNGDAPYARRVLAQIGLGNHFEGMQCIIDQNYVPKPDPQVYAQFSERHDIDPDRTIYFEDMARNLKPAKERGWSTVWLNNGSEWGNHGADDSFIDYHVDDLAPWLSEIGK